MSYCHILDNTTITFLGIKVVGPAENSEFLNMAFNSHEIMEDVKAKRFTCLHCTDMKMSVVNGRYKNG